MSVNLCSKYSVLAAVTGRTPQVCTRLSSGVTSAARPSASAAARTMAATCFSFGSKRSSVVAFHTAALSSSIPAVCRLSSPVCAFRASIPPRRRAARRRASKLSGKRSRYLYLWRPEPPMCKLSACLAEGSRVQMMVWRAGPGNWGTDPACTASHHRCAPSVRPRMTEISENMPRARGLAQ
eukprot:scaffold102147_cov29-Tisochrysis_lutea.AAC.8